MIPAGTRVRTCTEKDEGRFMRTRWCPVCDVFWERHVRHGENFGTAEIDGVNHGEFVEPDWRDTWESIRQELAETVKP